MTCAQCKAWLGRRGSIPFHWKPRVCTRWRVARSLHKHMRQAAKQATRQMHEAQNCCRAVDNETCKKPKQAAVQLMRPIPKAQKSLKGTITRSFHELCLHPDTCKRDGNPMVRSSSSGKPQPGPWPQTPYRVDTAMRRDCRNQEHKLAMKVTLRSCLGKIRSPMGSSLSEGLGENKARSIPPRGIR